MGYTVFVLYLFMLCYVRVLKGMHARIHLQEMRLLTMKRSDYLTRYFPGNIWSKTQLY